MTGALDKAAERRCRESFARQAFVLHLGGAVESLAPGRASLRLPFRAELAQQHGFFHAGALTTLADTAAGYAAGTLMPRGSGVLTVEFKVNLLAPAVGERFVATGRVLRAGRTLTVCVGEVHAVQGASRKQICLMQATMIRAEPAGSGG